MSRPDDSKLMRSLNRGRHRHSPSRHYRRPARRKTAVLALLLIIIAGGAFAVWRLALRSGEGQERRLIDSGTDIKTRPSAAPVGPIIDELVYDRSKLTETQNDLLDKLLAMHGEHPALAPIIENLQTYPDELIMLILHDPDAIDFVLGYPEHRFDFAEADAIDISEELTVGGFPHFLQWDERWGYLTYGDSNMAINGCGATALSIVAVGLGGNDGANPYAVAEFSEANGHFSGSLGTSWSLMSEGSANYGLTAKEIPADPNVLRNAVQNGPVIASMGPGTFTSLGHFLVLTEVTDDGKIVVLDPNSLVRSKAWDAEVFMEEGKNFWSMSKSE